MYSFATVAALIHQLFGLSHRLIVMVMMIIILENVIFVLAYLLSDLIDSPNRVICDPTYRQWTSRHPMMLSLSLAATFAIVLAVVYPELFELIPSMLSVR